MNEKNSNFPIETGSLFINRLQTLISLSVKALAVLMTLVVIWSVIDVGILIFDKVVTPPYVILNIEDILGTFGAFLVVLIAIEIFLNIILYLKKDVLHIKLVLATALMAISRKVIIIEYDKTPHLQLFGMGAVILALGITYWLVHRQQSEKPSSKNTE